jgi:dolichol-phosphate mannosyltransferase
MKWAVMLAIATSMLTNFFLNRRFSFADAREQSMWRQLVAFISACSIGAVVNYWVTIGTNQYTPLPQIAALLGVIAGTGFNFLASRYWVFRLKHYSEKTRSKKR